ncbi:hypothetical protein B0T16DRAFT_199167 [Cercophora newfieldiana]|uniref:Uncharacterized protein n=1 Tax=Cercophora newfieldiana TaxID=92897 RepID=A0AA39Y502_9PEZI|nr:hypothetical protein B0T16DRAFT_199167 [Cercophora newfieldiana]
MPIPAPTSLSASVHASRQVCTQVCKSASLQVPDGRGREGASDRGLPRAVAQNSKFWARPKPPSLLATRCARKRIQTRPHAADSRLSPSRMLGRHCRHCRHAAGQRQLSASCIELNTATATTGGAARDAGPERATTGTNTRDRPRRSRTQAAASKTRAWTTDDYDIAVLPRFSHHPPPQTTITTPPLLYHFLQSLTSPLPLPPPSHHPAARSLAPCSLHLLWPLLESA